REPVDTQGIRNAGYVAGGRTNAPARMQAGAAISRTVVRQPAHAELGSRREQRFGRLTEIRGAVMPEQGELSVAASVVCVQRPSVVQRQIDVFHDRQRFFQTVMTTLARACSVSTYRMASGAWLSG